MHAVTFMLKQAHLRNVAFGKRAVKHLPGMTPARFNLLFMLERAVRVPGWDPLGPARLQCTLWKDLGLHRSTVSRMILQLERMGWIRRVRAVDNRRTYTLFLTALGLATIERAMRDILSAQTFLLQYERIFEAQMKDMPRLSIDPFSPRQFDPREMEEDFDPSPPQPCGGKMREPGIPVRYPGWDGDVLDVVHEFYQSVRRIARHFGDRSNVWYHLGDCLPDHDRPCGA